MFYYYNTPGKGNGTGQFGGEANGKDRRVQPFMNNFTGKEDVT